MFIEDFAHEVSTVKGTWNDLYNLQKPCNYLTIDQLWKPIAFPTPCGVQVTHLQCFPPTNNLFEIHQTKN